MITPNGRIRLLPGTDAPVGRAKGSDDLGYALVGPPLEATLPRGMHLLVAMIWKEASGEPELLRRIRSGASPAVLDESNTRWLSERLVRSDPRGWSKEYEVRLRHFRLL